MEILTSQFFSDDETCDVCEGKWVCVQLKIGHACQWCSDKKRKCNFTNIEACVRKGKNPKEKLGEGSSKGKGDKKQKGSIKGKGREENQKGESSKAGQDRSRVARSASKEVGGMEEFMKMVGMNEELMKKICGLEKNVEGLKENVEGLKEKVEKLQESIGNIGERY